MTRTEYNDNIDRWSDDLYRFALRCCSDCELCKDAVQEAFIALWERLDSVDVSNGKGFLFMVVQRRLRDHFRRENIITEVHKELTNTTTTTHQQVERFELRDSIENALQQLPPTQRAILQLHDVEGYNYNEIAEILQMNYKQVQVYTFRARVAMKKKLTALGINSKE